MNKKKGYWYWWWENNCIWIIVPGIILLGIGVFYGMIRLAIYLADIFPDWLNATIMIVALVICISLLCAASYWKHQDYLK